MPSLLSRYIQLIIFLFAAFSLSVQANSSSSLFPQPAELKPDIDFWTRIYTEVSSKQGFIHDNRYLGVIYEKIDLHGVDSPKQRQKRVDAVKQKYKRILQKLASGKRSNLSKEERRVLHLWPKHVSNKELRNAHNFIRFQRGLSNHFKEGLVRSGRWRPYILQNLREMGLPEEIAVLPHVESSFNPKAYSHVGAAGMWQFTRSTGRQFMRVNYTIDERLDPFLASKAAAELLKRNYKTTGSWPLAITAYNHGAGGMNRAAKQTGGKDIVKILRNYKSRSFKFASRNFYLQFVAAINVRKNPEAYFGPIVYDYPEENSRLTLPNNIAASTIASHLDIDTNELKSLNPALRAPIWSSKKYIPSGYQLRIPTHQSKGTYAQKLASIPRSQQFKKQKSDRRYKVRRGDNISKIAKRFGVSVKELMAANNLRKKNFLKAGQVLKLPNNSKTRQYKASKTKQQLAKNTSKRSSYTVKRGDTIASISRKTGASQKQLMSLNSLSNKNKIFVGQKLVTQQGSSTAKKVQAAKLVKYKVRQGDNLSNIAKRHNVSINTVAQINGLRKNKFLRIGQVLKLPQKASVSVASSTPTQRYTVRQGDTLSSIAVRFGTTQSKLASLNKLGNKNALKLGQKLRVAASAGRSAKTLSAKTTNYKVRKGDSLSTIAKRFRVSLNNLLTINSLNNRHMVKVGQILTIPR